MPGEEPAFPHQRGLQGWGAAVPGGTREQRAAELLVLQDRIEAPLLAHVLPGHRTSPGIER